MPPKFPSFATIKKNINRRETRRNKYRHASNQLSIKEGHVLPMDVKEYLEKFQKTRRKQIYKYRFASKQSSKKSEESPMDVVSSSPMDVVSSSQMDLDKQLSKKSEKLPIVVPLLSETNANLPKGTMPLPKLTHIIKGSDSINTITNNIDRCKSILENKPSNNKLLNTLVNERNSISCFMQVIYGDDSINRHISEIKRKIIQYNNEESGFMVIYGGTSWNHNFSQDTLDKLDLSINADGKVDKSLRDVSFLKKNYDILVATSDKRKKKELTDFFTEYLQILKIKINILFDKHNIRCKCTLEKDNGTSGIGTILNDKECVKFRLLLNSFVENDLRDFPETNDALYELLNEDEKEYVRVSNYNNRTSRRVTVKKNKVQVNSGCNNELAFYIELGYDSNIDTARFKLFLIENEYLNKAGCFIIQSFLNTDRKDKGINIDEIRRFYCIWSIIIGKDKQQEYYDKILTPLQTIFPENTDIIEKLYLYGFKMFNATVSQRINTTTKRGDFNMFLEQFNSYLLESKDKRFLSTSNISIREYSNLLFIEINKYLIEKEYGLLAKAGGECMRYYIKDEKNEIKTKDFDCKLFINSSNYKNNMELVKKKILLLIIFTSLYFNELEKFKNVTDTYMINFAGKQYTINLYADKQSSLFSSRALYDFNVPLFSLDLRILYTITTPITNKTKKNTKKYSFQHNFQRNITGKKRLIKELTPSSKEIDSNDTSVDLDDIVVDVDTKHKKRKLTGGGGGKNHIIKNYFIETPIDIAITPDKINKGDINNILVQRENLPPILTLEYLKKDIEHTLNHPKPYLNRLFAGKIEKDKVRLGKLQYSLPDVYSNNSKEYIDDLDKLPDENSRVRLSSIFQALLNCNININGIYDINTDTVINEDKPLIEKAAKISKNAQRSLDKNKRFKTPFSLELLTQLIDNNKNEWLEENEEEEEKEDTI
jgi:hypothetical protein